MTERQKNKVIGKRDIQILLLQIFKEGIRLHGVEENAVEGTDNLKEQESPQERKEKDLKTQTCIKKLR